MLTEFVVAWFLEENLRLALKFWPRYLRARTNALPLGRNGFLTAKK
jgi:hypothetical protein